MSYTLESVPERLDGGSRWAIPESPGGRAMSPGQNLGIASLNRAAQIVKELETKPRPQVSVTIWGFVYDPNGNLVERVRGIVTAEQVHQPTVATRPGKFVEKSDLTDGQICDRALLGLDVPANDRQLFRAFWKTAIFHSLTGEDLRRWEDAAALVALARAGIRPPRRDQLPADHRKALTPTEALEAQAEAVAA